MNDISRVIAIRNLTKAAACPGGKCSQPGASGALQRRSKLPTPQIKAKSASPKQKQIQSLKGTMPRDGLYKKQGGQYVKVGNSINRFIDGYLLKAAVDAAATAAPGKKKVVLTPEQIEAEKQRRLRNAQKINKSNRWYNRALSGLANGVRWGWNATTGALGDLYENGIDNLNSGATSMVNGTIYGAADAVGFLGGLGGAVAGLGNGLFQYARGNPNYDGFWSSLGKGIKGGWDTGWDVVDNNIGFGDYDLGHLKRFIQQDNIQNREAYMDRNGIDPENPTWLDKGGLLGLSIADASGQMLGGMGGWTGTTKAIGTGGKLMLRAAKPVVNAMSTAGRAANAARGAETAANAARGAETAANAARGAETAANTARGAGTATNAAGTTTANTASNAGRLSRMTAGAKRMATGAKNMAQKGYGHVKPYLPGAGKALVGGFTGVNGVMDNNDFNNYFANSGGGEWYDFMNMSDLSSRVRWN